MYGFLWAYSAWNKLFYSILFYRTSYRKDSFFPSTIAMWNSLSESIKTSTRADQFGTVLYSA